MNSSSHSRKSADKPEREKAMTVKYQIAYYGKNHYGIWDDTEKRFIDCRLRLYHTKFDTFAEAKKIADEIRNASPDMAESVYIEGIECHRDC